MTRNELAQKHLTDGVAKLERGAFAAARLELIEAATLAPRSANAHYQLARAHAALGAMALAEQAARAAVALDPRHPAATHALGAMLAQGGDAAQAEPWLRRACELAPNDTQMRRDHASVLVFLGEMDAARATFLRALETDPLTAEVIDSLVRLQPMNAETAEAQAVREALGRMTARLDEMAPEGRSQTLFALAKTLEDQGEPDKAFDALVEANALRRAAFDFDIGKAEQRLAQIAAVFDAERLASLAPFGHPSDRPIFIVGMPRSGTTLVEQILSAHPSVHGGGELPILTEWIASSAGAGGAPYPDWARSMTGADCRYIAETYLDALPPIPPPRRRITDKWVDNFEHLGLIHLCLPNAAIIHCRRDPRDSGLSTFATRFVTGQAYSYDLTELGRYWRAYDRLMDHWRGVLPPGRMLEVPYEGLVEDVEGWARRLVAHCRLDWDEACLTFHQSRRPVRSASFAQVRQPIYTGSVGRWRAFAHRLGPLIEALGPPWNAI